VLEPNRQTQIGKYRREKKDMVKKHHTSKSRSVSVQRGRERGYKGTHQRLLRTYIVFKGVMELIDPVENAFERRHGSYIVHEDC